jgi:hypothetical protein
MTFFFRTPKWDSCCLEILNVHIFLNQAFLDNKKVIFYNFQKDLSNSVLHAPIKYHLTPSLRGFENLILDFSFDHNSCLSSLNEQCEGNLTI